MKELGIGDLENVDRVVIDLRMGHIPVIHVRHHGSGALLDVIEALGDGPRIEWVDDGQRRDEPDQTTFADGMGNRWPEPPPVDVRPDPWLRAPAPGSPA